MRVSAVDQALLDRMSEHKLLELVEQLDDLAGKMPQTAAVSRARQCLGNARHWLRREIDLMTATDVGGESA